MKASSTLSLEIWNYFINIQIQYLIVFYKFNILQFPYFFQIITKVGKTHTYISKYHTMMSSFECPSNEQKSLSVTPPWFQRELAVCTWGNYETRRLGAFIPSTCSIWNCAFDHIPPHKNKRFCKMNICIVIKLVACKQPMSWEERKQI